MARHIVSWLEAGRDEVTLLGFDKAAHRAAVHDAAVGGGDEARRVEPYASRSLYDAIAEAARPLVVRTRPRRAVVLITDGIDTASVMSAPEVSRWPARSTCPSTSSRSRRRRPDRRDARHGEPRRRGRVAASLEDLARWTRRHVTAGTPAERAGRAAHPDRAAPPVLIAFEPAPARVALAVGRGAKKNVFVRARGGYMAGSNAGSL